MITLDEIKAVQDAYLNTLGREADAGGLEFYTQQLDSGKSIDDIIADLSYSKSSTSTSTPTTSTSSTTSTPKTTSTGGGMWADASANDYANIGKYTIEDLYREEFGRKADAEGLAFYQGLVNEGYTPRQIREIFNSSEEGKAYDLASEGKARNPITGAIISGTPEEYQQYVDKFGTGTIVRDGFSDWQRAFPNESFPAGMLDPNVYNPILAQYGQETDAGWVGGVTPDSVAQNYSSMSKRPDETMTQYYQRLQDTRSGGILGQGLLSSQPTPGSEAAAASEVKEMFSDYFPKANGEGSSDSGFTAPTIDSLQRMLDYKEKGFSDAELGMLSAFGNFVGIPMFGTLATTLADYGSSDLSGTAQGYLDKGYITEDEYNQFLNNMMQPDSMKNTDYSSGSSSSSSGSSHSGQGSWSTPGGYTGERGTNVPAPK